MPTTGEGVAIQTNAPIKKYPAGAMLGIDDASAQLRRSLVGSLMRKQKTREETGKIGRWGIVPGEEAAVAPDGQFKEE
ncbi:hypothetical protein HDU93_002374 [Gonapodya sp. JEL0774]|nr:hypothetical protein HDU93_002374 [Gonapodya sp. JEL0774]